jgi:hypothetical protein
LGDLNAVVLLADGSIADCSKKIQRGLRSLLDEMQTEAVLFFHLFLRAHSSAKATELGKFLLDSL